MPEIGPVHNLDLSTVRLSTDQSETTSRQKHPTIRCEHEGCVIFKPKFLGFFSWGFHFTAEQQTLSKTKQISGILFSQGTASPDTVNYPRTNHLITNLAYSWISFSTYTLYFAHPKNGLTSLDPFLLLI